MAKKTHAVTSGFFVKGQGETREERIDDFFKTAKKMLQNAPEAVEVCVFILDSKGEVTGMSAKGDPHFMIRHLAKVAETLSDANIHMAPKAQH